MGASSPAMVVDLIERCWPSERPQGHIARDRKVFLSPDYKEEQPIRAKTPHEQESLQRAIAALVVLLSLLSCGQWSKAPAAKPEREHADTSPDQVGGSERWLDENGRYIYPGDDYPFSEEGLARVEVDSKWGYIDKSGKYAIEPQFSQVEDFSGGRAKVVLHGESGYVDKTGRFTPEE